MIVIVIIAGIVLFCLLNLTIIFGKKKKKNQIVADLFSAYFIFALWWKSEITKIIYDWKFKNSTQNVYELLSCLVRLLIIPLFIWLTYEFLDISFGSK